MLNNNMNQVLADSTAITGTNYIAGGTSARWSEKTTEERQKDAFRYIGIGKDRVLTTLDINKDEAWSDLERKYLSDIGHHAEEIGRLLEIVKNIPLREMQFVEVQQKLAENPVDSIRVEQTDDGDFKIIKKDTGEILFTENVEVTIKLIAGMYRTQGLKTSAES